jgi:hypothetical protein
MIPPNTEAVYVYNVAAIWMSQKQNRIRIKISNTGKPTVGMDLFLTSRDRIWDGVYNFEFFKATVNKKRIDMADFGFNPEENVDVVIDLKTAVFHYKVNRFLKLPSIKKIIKNGHLKNYNTNPLFENEVASPYPDNMCIEMSCGNPIQAHLLEQRPFSIKVNYIGGKDVIVTDDENRVYNLNIIFEYYPEEVWICVNNNCSLVKVELKRFEYEVMKDECYHNFNAMICSACNYLALKKYINLLIGWENRLMEIYVDGNLWT